jgi:hypothetical protein
MRPAFLFVGILLCLAMQPPMESSLGRFPLPPVIGMRGPFASGDPQAEKGTGMFDLEFLKYGITQGGLTIVCLVVFAFYRRDFLRKIKDAQGDKAILIDLVQKNTRAYGRLVTALDRRHLVAEESGDDD